MTFHDLPWPFVTFCDLSWPFLTFPDLSSRMTPGWPQDDPRMTPGWHFVTLCDTLWHFVTALCDNTLWQHFVTLCDTLWHFVTLFQTFSDFVTLCHTFPPIRPPGPPCRPCRPSRSKQLLAIAFRSIPLVIFHYSWPMGGLTLFLKAWLPFLETLLELLGTLGNPLEDFLSILCCTDWQSTKIKTILGCCRK